MLSVKELFGTDTIPDNLNFIYEERLVKAIMDMDEYIDE